MIYWQHTYMQGDKLITCETLKNAAKFTAEKLSEGFEIKIINSTFNSFSKKYKLENPFLN